MTKAIDEIELLMKFKTEMEAARRSKLEGSPIYTSDDMLKMAEEIMEESTLVFQTSDWKHIKPVFPLVSKLSALQYHHK